MVLEKGSPGSFPFCCEAEPYLGQHSPGERDPLSPQTSQRHQVRPQQAFVCHCPLFPQVPGGTADWGEVGSELAGLFNHL